jgi:hypothetical protein
VREGNDGKGRRCPLGLALTRAIREVLRQRAGFSYRFPVQRACRNCHQQLVFLERGHNHAEPWTGSRSNTVDLPHKSRFEMEQYRKVSELISLWPNCACIHLRPVLISGCTGSGEREDPHNQSVGPSSPRDRAVCARCWRDIPGFGFGYLFGGSR